MSSLQLPWASPSAVPHPCAPAVSPASGAGTQPMLRSSVWFWLRSFLGLLSRAGQRGQPEGWTPPPLSAGGQGMEILEEKEGDP